MPVIGELDVLITGDYESLDSAISQAATSAEAGGRKISEALGSGAATAAGGVQSLEDRIQALVDSGHTLQEALQLDAAGMDKLQGSAATAATANEAVGSGAQQAASGLKSFADQAKAAADAAQRGSESAAEFLQTLIGFGGIALTFEGLRRALIGSIEAFDRVDDATTALTALTGSAKTAVENIEQMRELAQSNALSFPELLKADQNMAAFGFDAARIPGLLQAAADAAAVTGKGFDSTAQALERIVATGHLAGRQLVALGLTINDVAAAMGASVDEAAELFKGLDQSARIDILTQSLGKFAGLAQKTTDDVLGDWQRLKNQAEFTFEGVGQAIDPAGRALIKLASISLENIVPAIKAIGDLSREIVTTVSVLRDAGTQFSTFIESATGVPITVNDITAGLRNMNLVLNTMAPYVTALTELLKLMNAALGKTAEAAPGVEQTAKATEHLAKTDVKPAADGLQSVATAGTAAHASLTKLDPVVDDLRKKMQALGAASTTSGAAFLNAWSLSVMQAPMKAAVDAFKELQKAQTDASNAVEIARGVLVQAEKELKNHTATTQDVTRARNALTKAIEEANPVLVTQEAILTTSQKIWKDFISELNKIEDSNARVVEFAAIWRDAVANFGEESDKAKTALKLYNDELNRLGITAADLSPSLAKTTADIVVLTGHTGEAATAVTVAVEKFHAAGDGFKDVTIRAGNLAGAFDGMTVSAGKQVISLGDLKTALDDVDRGLIEDTNEIVNNTAERTKAITVLTGHSSTLRDMNSYLADAGVKLADVNTGTKSVNDALLAMFPTTRAAANAAAGYSSNLTLLASTSLAAAAAQETLASAIRNVNSSILAGGSLDTSVNSGPGGKGGGGGGGRGGGAQLFDPNNPNAGGYIVTNGGRTIDYIRPNSVIPFAPNMMPGGGGGGGTPAQAAVSGVMGGIDFGALASGVPTALGQVQTSIYATVPAAAQLQSAVSALAGTFAGAAGSIVSQADAVAAALNLPPPGNWEASPLSLLPPIAPTAMPAPGSWSAAPMRLGPPAGQTTVYIQNPTVTNQSQLDQMVTQLQNTGSNTR